MLPTNWWFVDVSVFPLEPFFPCKNRFGVKKSAPPPKKTRPFFAGVTVFFIDPPELDMDFTGAADFVDLPVIRSVVRCLYGGSVSKGPYLLHPARMYTPPVKFNSKRPPEKSWIGRRSKASLLKGQLFRG